MKSPAPESIVDIFSRHSLLRTKLSMPSHFSKGRVVRPRLNRKLGGEILRPVSLICAPAGFGKTTALVNFLENGAWPVAWMSIDEADNDVNRFLQYFIASFQSVQPGLGAFAFKSLVSPTPPKAISLMPMLINELHALEQDVVLALDDYHLITSEEVHSVLNLAIDQLPPHLHIAITSRSAPPFPLPRMRVRQQLSEIGESDLRFTEEEAKRFFSESAELELKDDDVAILESRTEGWAAGLQLAALSLQQEVDKAAFIDAFAGDDRYVTDYLTEEVLKRQNEEIRQFLFRTSILERLNGSLCDAVTGNKNSAALLAQLEQSDMFLIPLDSRRECYRYHHLFSDLLRQQLSQVDQAEIDSLHERACRWFLDNDAPIDAIHHAQLIENYELVLEVFYRYGKQLFLQGQGGTLSYWYEQLPRKLLNQHPQLLINYAWSKYVGVGEFDAGLIREIEQGSEKFDVASEERQCLEGDLKLMKAFQALQERDFKAAIELSSSLIDLMKETEAGEKAAPYLNLGAAYFGLGELDKARRAFQVSFDLSLGFETLVCLNGATGGMASCHARKGELTLAEEQLLKGLKLLEKRGWLASMIDSSWLWLSLGNIAYERNQLDEAVGWYDKAAQFAARDRWDTIEAMVEIRRAKLHFYQGHPEAVEAHLQHLEKLKPAPALLPLLPEPELDRVLFALRRGEMDLVDAWLEDSGCSANGDIPLGFENEYRLFARVLLTRGQVKDAVRVLNHLQPRAQAQGCTADLIQLLILQSLARQKQGNVRQAQDYLKQALMLTKEQGFVRSYVDEGKPLAMLLERLQDDKKLGSYVGQLLSGFGDDIEVDTPATQLLSLLSKKELKTLKLLAQGLSNSEIAEQSFVSVNTVKTHLKNIYSKLEVENRVQAIEQARKLND